MGRIPMPIADYVTDLRGVSDNALRVLHALIDTAAEARLLSTALVAMRLVQALSQVRALRRPTDTAALVLVPAYRGPSCPG